MSGTAIDVIVGLTLFVLGVSWTVYRYARHDRTALTIVAVLSPVIAVVAIVRLVYLAVTKRVTVGPCPVGLDDAERAVAIERQRLFGGELKEPSMAVSWKRAYQLELQQDTDRVQKVAERYFIPASV